MNRSPRRFYFEQLILNRGFETIDQFCKAYSDWADRHGKRTVSSATIRGFITGRALSGTVTQSISEFLMDAPNHDLIVAMWYPPDVFGAGGYWREAYVVGRMPRLIRDINIFDANLRSESNINYLDYLK